jgi:hypothetical protein
MEIEVLVGIIAVFISGGGVGVGATLFTQWVHKKLTWRPPEQPRIQAEQMSGLQNDVDDLTKAVLDLNQRMEFQERLISGEAREDLEAETVDQGSHVGFVPPTNRPAI